MPKVVINRARNASESRLITERTQEICNALKSLSGCEFIDAKIIMQYLGCSRRSVTRYTGPIQKYKMPALRKACGTRKFRAIDVARRLAELEVLTG
jgi:hypothetical protein